MKPSFRVRLGLAAACVLATAGVQAHGLTLTAQGEGAYVTGQALYSDRTPATGIFVSVSLEDGGKPVAEGATGADGRFRLAAPAGQRLRVVAEGEEGHRTETIAEPIAVAITDTEAATATLRLLREDIARLEHRMRLQDILGGLGYIVGIAGIAAWIAARRRR